ncbi:Protein of uncharacterised function (DUF554) [Fusobacterium necrogenes]|uniref:Protein of uncharacterized function (DUF554) n=1 Tax=Fusobacterium necrogenes TaxID=858 RepID=A0A377GY44_9FUSO|nr:DUF554 domain-containing protein [Fusobacterium necrogenes]STO31773.1 Protein of uncharacterised function (DUF554) [Fusobacterium necrogenes]
MLGTIVNTCAIIIGSLLGGILKKGISKKYELAMLNSCGLAACGIGLNSITSNMTKSQYPILFIVSLVFGSIIGTKFNLDSKLQNLIKKYTRNALAEGIVSATLLFCIGSLSIVGSVMAALKDDYTFLFTNASLDFITSIIFSSTYGIGITIAAFILFTWQGSIYFLTKYICMDFFTDDFIVELSIVGGFLITATGLEILKIKNIKTINLLPAILILMLFFVIKRFL